MLKKVSIGLLALVGVSSSAFAAHVEDVTLPAAPAAINVTAPVQQGSWAFGLEALYQESVNADYRYASTTNDGVTKIHAVEPDHHWGVHGDVTYNFAGNGRFVTLGITHIDMDESDSVSGTTISDGPAEGFENATGKQDDEFTEVDLVFGQRIDVGQRVQLKPFAGIRYSDIEAHNKVTGVNADTSHRVWKDNADFEGIGPRFGMDANVKLGMGFSITGRIAGSLLVGDADNKISETNVDDAGAITSTNTYNYDDHTRVVPEADARLGVNYTYSFNPDTALGLELGYEVVNYFDVVDESFISDLDTTSHESDLGRHGPYLRVQLDIA